MIVDLTEQQRDDLERAILARLEAKSEHMYQWPRWPAAYEASMAVATLVARWIADGEQRGCAGEQTCEAERRAYTEGYDRAWAESAAWRTETDAAVRGGDES